MSDTPTTTAPDPAAPSASDDSSQMALVVYILFLAGFITGITPIVGVILAYVYKDTAPEWVRSHYINAIHIFWKGLLYLVISILLSVVLIGVLLLLVQMIWYIVRCAKGIQGVTSRTAYRDPQSWGF